MHIIIVGCGRVGSQLSQMLSAEGHDIVVVDKNSSSFKRLGPTFNGITITGVGFDPEILKRAGIERADALAAVTNGDNSNIMIGQIAKRIFEVPRVIARIYDPERSHIYKRFGLETICSTTIGANIIKNMILHKDFLYRCSVGGDSAIVEFKISDKLAGRKLSSLNIEGELLLTGIIRGPDVIISKTDVPLEAGDTVIGLAKILALVHIKEFFGLPSTPKKTISKKEEE